MPIAAWAAASTQTAAVLALCCCYCVTRWHSCSSVSGSAELPAFPGSSLAATRCLRLAAAPGCTQCWLAASRSLRGASLTRRPSPAQPPKGKAKPAPVPAAAKKPAAAVAPKPSNPLLEEKRPKHFGPSPSRRRAASSETLVLILLLTALPSRHWPGLAAQDAAQPLCEVAEIRPHPAPAPRAHQAPEGACPPAALLLQHAPS